MSEHTLVPCTICGRSRHVKSNRQDPDMCGSCKAMHAIFFANPLGDWVLEAACARTDPEAFFPVPGTPTLHAEMAKAACWGCPVRQECLEYALAANMRYGVWGGYDAKEREQMSFDPKPPEVAA